MAVAAAALSVRFLVNLSTGELLCIVVGLNATTSNFTFGSLAGPAHATLAAYAAQVGILSKSMVLMSKTSPPLLFSAFISPGPRLYSRRLHKKGFFGG